MSFSQVMRHDFPEEVPRPGPLAALRERIRHIEQPASHAFLSFGVAAIDRALPGGGLALGAVHEFLGIEGDEEDGAAAGGFIAGLLARLRSHPVPTSPSQRCALGPSLSPLKGGEGNGTHLGNSLSAPKMQSEGGGRLFSLSAPKVQSDGGGRLFSLSAPGGGEGRGEVGDSKTPGEGIVLWCLKRPDLYGPGLLAHGLDPARLVIVTAPRDEDILWAIEEGLRAPGLVAVIGEIGRLPLVAGRRLQLAAERSGITAFLLRRWRNSEEAARERERPSAAVTRWRLAALPAREVDDLRLRQLIGQPRWRVELLRCRGGVPAQWVVESGDVEVADATGHVRLSPALADRPAAPVDRKEGRLAAEPRLRFG